MRFRTWIVAALGLGGLLLLIIVSMVASSRKAQEIYTQLDQLNTYHQNVDASLRRLRSDVNLSGIFLRDYLLDVARERAPEYRENLAEFRESNKTTVAELLVLDEPQGRANSQPWCATRRMPTSLTSCERSRRGLAPTS